MIVRNNLGSSIDLPPTLRAEREGPPLPKRPWYLGIGPAYLTIFVWAPFFDPLWAGDLPRGRPALAGRHRGHCIVDLLRVLLLPHGDLGTPDRPAVWGSWRLRRSARWARSGSPGSGSGSPSSSGSPWRSIMGSNRRLLGLITCGHDPPGRVGPLAGRPVQSDDTRFSWPRPRSGSSSRVRRACSDLVAVIAALMKIYAPVALLLAHGIGDLADSGPGDYRVEHAVDVARESFWASSMEDARFSALPLFTGFFAMLGLLSVDWGAGSARRRDVTVGGLAGIVLAGSWTAIMALLVVAGAVGRLRSGRSESGRQRPPIRRCSRFDGASCMGSAAIRPSVILILFGLAALAPACYSAWVFSFRVRGPLVGHPPIELDLDRGGDRAVADRAGLAQPARHDRLLRWELVFAPAVGAMAGDFLDQWGRWAGVRHGLNAAGMLAWSAGVALKEH